jgi:hypothetical protein
MPAARQSQASIQNVLDAAIAAGLSPARLEVKPDGSFFLDFHGSEVLGSTPRTDAEDFDAPPSYDE